MSDDAKNCTVCGEKIRKPSPLFSTCAKHRTPEEKRAAWAAAKRKSDGKKRPATDDSVLSRMGFKTEADEAPPPAPVRKPRKPKPAALAVAPGAPTAARDLPKWQGQFTVLAFALGLDPGAMLEGYCREWVEATRARALKPAPAKDGLETAIAVVEDALARKAEESAEAG